MQLVAKAWAKYYKTSSYITPMLALHASKISSTLQNFPALRNYATLKIKELDWLYRWHNC